MEIPNPSIFEDLEALKRDNTALELDLYCYFLNGKVFNIKNKKSVKWTGPSITQFKNFRSFHDERSGARNSFKKDSKFTKVENAGWHFNNLLTAEKLYNKLINQGHHNEFDDSGITLENLKAKIENRLAFYNHKADKKDNDKYNFEYKLKKISDDQLPKYLVENKEKYQKWFD